MSATLSQDAKQLNLKWVHGDPVSLGFTVKNVDWSGTYTAQIRKAQISTSALLGALTVTATLVGADTVFTLTMSAVNSALIPAGNHFWDLQQTGGVTRLRGVVEVEGQVSV